MTQIQKPLEYISKALGKQNYNKSVKYRMLYFCISVSVDDGILLFNNLTKEFLLLSDKEFELLNQSDFMEPSNLVQTLAERWFLVQKNNNDFELCEQLRQLVGALEQTIGIRFYTILTTTACNARCFYCFEEGIPVVTMTKATADAVADYIIRNCKGQQVALNWFGGEPLCNYRAIDQICTKLLNNNIKFYSRMDSNSYLFNEEIIDKAVRLWNLQTVHVTLDGMPETYNKVKNYANNDSNAFDHVLNNIKKLCDNNVPVLVRFNMDSHNANELYDLIDLLHEKFYQYDKFSVYVTTLYEGPGEASRTRTNADRLILSKQVSDITNYIESKGLKSRKFSLNNFSYYSCQADKKDYVVISPDGHLAFCEHYVSDDFYGTVYEDVEKPFWSEYRKATDDCKTCAFLPSCRRLSRCPTSGGECYEYKKIIYIDSIKKNMKKCYNNYKKQLMLKKTGD